MNPSPYHVIANEGRVSLINYIDSPFSFIIGVKGYVVVVYPSCFTKGLQKNISCGGCCQHF